MRDHRSTIAGIVFGFGLGLVAGLYFAAPLKIDADRWWALFGAALGAVVAIAGSIIAIHYEANQTEKADRRRIAGEIEGVLKHVRAFNKASTPGDPPSAELRETMQTMSAEYRHILIAIKAIKHTSAEMARAYRQFGEGHADRVHMLATSNHTDSWDADARKHVDGIERTLKSAKRELDV